MNFNVSLFFCIASVLTLSGCGGGSSDSGTPSPQPNEPVAAPVDAPTQPGSPSNPQTPAPNLPMNVVVGPTVPSVPVQSMPDIGPFTEDNIEDALLFSVSSVRGDRVMDLVDLLDDIENRVVQDDPGFVLQSETIDGFTRVHACPGGGLYMAVLINAIPAYSIRQFDFRECVVDGIEFNNGYVHRALNDGISPANFEVSQYTLGGEAGFAVVDVTTGPRIEIKNPDGVIRRIAGQYSEGVDGAYARTRLRDIDLQTVDGDTAWVEHYHSLTVLSGTSGEPDSDGNIYGRRYDFVSMYFGKGPSDSLLVNFIDQSVTSGGQYDVSMPENIERPLGQPNVASGQLDVSYFVPGMGLVGNIAMQPDNGNPNSFDVITESGGVSIMTRTVDWTPDYNLEGFRPRSAERLLYVE